MKILFKLASYLFHPIWMPFAGSSLYFALTPRFFPEGVMKAKLLAIAILTMFIPIVFHFLLQNLGKVRSVFLSDVRERKWPLFFFLVLLIMVLKQILNVYNYPALYYYFVGILLSTVICYILSFMRIKASLHMTGLMGFTTFLIAMSAYYQLNLIYSISFLVVALGITASSRLYYKAHTYRELIIGVLIGMIPQILVVKYWL